MKSLREEDVEGVQVQKEKGEDYTTDQGENYHGQRSKCMSVTDLTLSNLMIGVRIFSPREELLGRTGLSYLIPLTSTRNHGDSSGTPSKVLMK